MSNYNIEWVLSNDFGSFYSINGLPYFWLLIVKLQFRYLLESDDYELLDFDNLSFETIIQLRQSNWVK